MIVGTEKFSNVPIVTEETLKDDIQELDNNRENVEEGDEKSLNSYSSDDEDVISENPEEEKIEGWADAMSKVLAKTGPKNAETMILAKESLPELDPELKKQKSERNKKKRKKRAWEDMNYAKPDPLKKQYERSLQKIATRGVVQLFNAVRKHQTDMEEKLEDAKTETKKERLYKNIDKKKFLQMLSGDQEKPQEEDMPEEPVETEEPAWKVLRDDFLIAERKKKTDWDEQGGDDDGNKEKKGKVKKTETPKKKKKKS